MPSRDGDRTSGPVAMVASMWPVMRPGIPHRSWQRPIAPPVGCPHDDRRALARCRRAGLLARVAGDLSVADPGARPPAAGVEGVVHRVRGTGLPVRSDRSAIADER